MSRVSFQRFHDSWQGTSQCMVGLVESFMWTSDPYVPPSLSFSKGSFYLSHSMLHIKCCHCSVTKLYLTLCDPMDSSIIDFFVLHHLLEFAHVHWVSDHIQPSYPLSSPSPLAFNLSKHQGLFQWTGSSYQVAKVY